MAQRAPSLTIENGAQAKGCAHLSFGPSCAGSSRISRSARCSASARLVLGVSGAIAIARTVIFAATSSRTGQCDTSRLVALAKKKLREDTEGPGAPTRPAQSYGDTTAYIPTLSDMIQVTTLIRSNAKPFKGTN